jgi:hypothetical protein
MYGNLGAVGASASASKKDAGLDGQKSFDPKGGVSIRAADNGGFIVSAHMKKTRKGAKQDYPEYCPPEESVFETFESASGKIAELFGAGGASDGDTPA